jgi:archaemetzincin
MKITKLILALFIWISSSNKSVNFGQSVTIVLFENNHTQNELSNQISVLYGVTKINIIKETLPSSSYVRDRNRYRADSILLFLNRLNKGITLGITTKDISCTKDNKKDWGVFGLGSSNLKSGIISSYRLKTDKDVISTALHELGHIYGLPHCSNPKCLMADANGKYIEATYWMCDSCKKQLK